LPSKVNVLIELLTDLYGLEAYWNSTESIDAIGMSKANAATVGTKTSIKKKRT